MITYSWNIKSIKVKPSLDDLTNVISEIAWEYIGIDENSNIALISLVTQVSDPNIEDFIPYDQVTKSMVISWLENILDIEALQQGIEAKINNIKNPPLIQVPLPWNI